MIVYRWPDYRARRVWVDGRRVRLLADEAEALLALAVNRGRVVSYATLADAIYGERSDGGPLCLRRAVRDRVLSPLRRLLPAGALAIVKEQGAMLSR